MLSRLASSAGLLGQLASHIANSGGTGAAAALQHAAAATSHAAARWGGGAAAAAQRQQGFATNSHDIFNVHKDSPENNINVPFEFTAETMKQVRRVRKGAGGPRRRAACRGAACVAAARGGQRGSRPGGGRGLPPRAAPAHPLLPAGSGRAQLKRGRRDWRRPPRPPAPLALHAARLDPPRPPTRLPCPPALPGRRSTRSYPATPPTTGPPPSSRSWISRSSRMAGGSPSTRSTRSPRCAGRGGAGRGRGGAGRGGSRGPPRGRGPLAAARPSFDGRSRPRARAPRPAASPGPGDAGDPRVRGRDLLYHVQPLQDRQVPRHDLRHDAVQVRGGAEGERGGGDGAGRGGEEDVPARASARPIPLPAGARRRPSPRPPARGPAGCRARRASSLPW
jgi:hypothetical protein